MAASWETVLPMWKKRDDYVKSGLLEPEAIEKTFPVKGLDAERVEMWTAIHAASKNYITLAEYDAWCNAQLLKYERANVRKRSTGAAPLCHRENNASLWSWGRAPIALAFSFGNSRTLTKPNVAAVDGDFVTKREFYVLLCATQCALRLYRVFAAETCDAAGAPRVGKEADWIPNARLRRCETFPELTRVCLFSTVARDTLESRGARPRDGGRDRERVSRRS